MLLELYDPLVNLLNWEWLQKLTVGSIAIRLILAVICGGLIGAERSKKHMAAGFRTYILVCLGSAVAMMTNQFLSSLIPDSDGARLGAQVISGIGFLGAGTIILTSRNQIRGLTTAAGLWAVACIGLSIGIGCYTLSILSTAIILLIFVLLPSIEKLLSRKSLYFPVHIEFTCRQDMKEFLSYARSRGLKVSQIEHNPAYSASGLSVYTMVLYITDKTNRDHEAYLEDFSKLDYVKYIEEMK